MNDPLTQESKTYENKPDTTMASHAFSQKTLLQENQARLAQDTISDLFHTRDQIKDRIREQAFDQKTTVDKDKNIPTRQSQENTSPSEEEPSSSDLTKKEETQKSAVGPKQEDAPLELQRLQEELTKTQKRLVENQQYGRQNAQRLKNALKLAKEFVEEGSLSEEEAAKLIGTLDSDLEEDLSSYASHPFGKVLAIANQELENIRKYTDDASLDDKIRAFDYFLMVASKEEQEQALEDLTDMKDNPLKLAKAMLERGQRYQTSYQEMKAAGSLYELLNKKDQTLLDLRKTLDKLTKKLAQYEDYDKPRYRLDEMGESEETASQDSISSLFNDRDRIRRR